MRKEEADALRKAEDDVKKKIALTNMGSGFSSNLQRVLLILSFGVRTGLGSSETKDIIQGRHSE